MFNFTVLFSISSTCVVLATRSITTRGSHCKTHCLISATIRSWFSSVIGSYRYFFRSEPNSGFIIRSPSYHVNICRRLFLTALTFTSLDTL